MPEAGPEHLTFDSADFPRAERFARYRTVNAGGAEAFEAGPHFAARLERWRFDRAVLHARQLNDVIHERAGGLGDFDHFMIHLVRSGSYEVDAGQGAFAVPPGGIVLIDMMKPMRSRAQHAHVVTISLARSLMIDAAGGVEPLHGMVLDAARAGLLADFLTSLTQRASALPPSALVGMSRIVAGLLGTALGMLKGEDHAEDSRLDVARLERARRLVEQNIGNPLFGPEMLVTLSGMSRASLYRLFKPSGGCLAYIQRRRLDRVRIALSDLGDQRPIERIAAEAGFHSESHCSRMFRTAYGVRPGEYRAELARAETQRQISYWHAELR